MRKDEQKMERGSPKKAERKIIEKKRFVTEGTGIFMPVWLNSFILFYYRSDFSSCKKPSFETDRLESKKKA